jgi:flagellar protein FliO/FliZ
MRKILLGATIGLALAVSAAAEDQVIYPRSAVLAGAPPTAPAGGFNGSLLVLAIAAAGAGGWLLWRQRRAPGGLGGRDARKLAVAESRSLGNRQYLVVADYDGRKFLIGVCPGRIDMLAPLDGQAPASRTT